MEIAFQNIPNVAAAIERFPQGSIVYQFRDRCFQLAILSSLSEVFTTR